MSHFLETKQYVVYTIQWSNPHTEPPAGMPKYLWGCSMPQERHFEIRENLEKIVPACPPGYGHHVNFGDIKIKRKVSPEGKAKIRKDRMIKRVQKKDPLFAEQIIDKELKRGYFNPYQIALDDKEKKQLFDKYFKEMDKTFIEKSVCFVGESV